jgi:hypothetical protein
MKQISVMSASDLHYFGEESAGEVIVYSVNDTDTMWGIVRISENGAPETLCDPVLSMADAMEKAKQYV